MSSLLSAALLDPVAPLPPGLRAWNASDAAVRFGVYRNNVVASLVAALADTFPVARELTGGTFFDAMAAAFVRANPPRTRVLAEYGGDFPAFIAGFEPAAALAYLADVARLEWARVLAQHAADAQPVGLDAARAALARDDAAHARIRLHPSLQLVAARHAAVSIWAAHQGDGDLGHVDPYAPEFAIVLRPELEVIVVPCEEATLCFAKAVRAGATLAEAACTFDLAASLGLLLTHGAVAGIELPGVSP